MQNNTFLLYFNSQIFPQTQHVDVCALNTMILFRGLPQPRANEIKSRRTQIFSNVRL